MVFVNRCRSLKITPNPDPAMQEKLNNCFNELFQFTNGAFQKIKDLNTQVLAMTESQTNLIGQLNQNDQKFQIKQNELQRQLHSLSEDGKAMDFVKLNSITKGMEDLNKERLEAKATFEIKINESKQSLSALQLKLNDLQTSSSWMFEDKQSAKVC